MSQGTPHVPFRCTPLDPPMMLPSRRPHYWLRILGRGLRLRCPHCNLGRTFDGLFTMCPVCPYCLCRYERKPGDAIGGVYINVLLAEGTALAGFLLMAGTDTPAPGLLFLWSIYTLVFIALFYRRLRGLAVALLYLAGQVYPDPDTQHEYERGHSAPFRSASSGARRTWE